MTNFNKIIIKKLKQIKRRFQKQKLFYHLNVYDNPHFLNKVKQFKLNFSIFDNWFYDNYNYIKINNKTFLNVLNKSIKNKQDFSKNYISKKSVKQFNDIMYNDKNNPFHSPNRKIDQQFYNRNNKDLQNVKRYTIITSEVPQNLSVYSINRNLKQLVDVNSLYATTRNLILISYLKLYSEKLRFISNSTNKNGKVKLDNQGNVVQQATIYTPNLFKIISNYNRLIPTFKKTQIISLNEYSFFYMNTYYNRYIPSIDRKSFKFLNNKKELVKYEQKSKLLYFCDINFDKTPLKSGIDENIPNDQYGFIQYKEIKTFQNFNEKVSDLQNKFKNLNLNKDNACKKYYKEDYLKLESLSNNDIIITIPNSFVNINMDYSSKWDSTTYIGNLLPIGTYNGISKILNFQIQLISQNEGDAQINILKDLENSLIPNRGKNNQFIGNIFKITFLNNIYYGILKDISRTINNSQANWLGDLNNLEIKNLNHYSVNLTFNLIDKEVKQNAI